MFFGAGGLGVERAAFLAPESRQKFAAVFNFVNGSSKDK
jgi:hypothetical protein